MARYFSSLIRFVGLLCTIVPVAQSACSNNLTSTGPALQLAKGVATQVITNNLNAPRGIVFDKSGHLLVIDRPIGVKALTLKDNGGTCVSVSSTQVIVSDSTLNHGIALSIDGLTLYASSVNSVFSWDYDPTTATVNASSRKTLITGMFNTDHSTRTMLVSHKKPGTMVVNRGSQSNIDPKAANISTGHGQVKAFDISSLGTNTYDFTANGSILAWGIRNDVGIDENPVTGGIWTVENSVDDISRYGVDFHNNNPGEKLNYMGTLVNNQSPNQGSNFGYPYCYAAWLPNDVPRHGDLVTGEQFTIRPKLLTDAQCQQRTAPRLVFDAHMAPLDIKFGPAASYAFVSFHGSHDRAVPEGYKVSKISFKNGQPVQPSTSRHSLMDLVQVGNKTSCPGDCMRPVGIELDSKLRLYFSSDNTGEIYVVTGVFAAQ